MDKELLNKYFNDQCSGDELDEVLSWFNTEEGQSFIEEEIDEQYYQNEGNQDAFLYPEIDSEKVFNKIQLYKKRDTKANYRIFIRVVAILLLIGTFSIGLYWSGAISTNKKKSSPATITYQTKSNQHDIISLLDGTKIYLNEESSLTVPQNFGDTKRVVQLNGEAYFEVAHDPAHPFLVNAIGSTVEVLGTKFNVKTNSKSEDVQVAVVKGKVALKKKGKEHEASALLTRNHFGILHLQRNQITIEKGNVSNYLSWLNNRLIFKGESLLTVSRQLEHIYHIKIEFSTNKIKALNLTANFQKTDLKDVLKIISNSLDIHFRVDNNRVIWKK